MVKLTNLEYGLSWQLYDPYQTAIHAYYGYEPQLSPPHTTQAQTFTFQQLYKTNS
jgi:hypothetical protein